MPAGLDIGRAGFGFALNSVSAIRGLTSFASGVTGMTSKVVPQIGGVAKGFDSMSNSLGGTFRSLDRFSRGIRGVTPELAAHRENIYRLQDSMARLSREVDISKARLNERTATLEAARRAGESLAIQLNDQKRSMAYANDELGQAKLKLYELTTSTKAHGEALHNQQTAVTDAYHKLEIHNLKMVEARNKIQDLIATERTFDVQLDVQAGKISAVTTRLNTINEEYQQHQDEIDKLIAKKKTESATMRSSEDQIARLGQSYKAFYSQAAAESTNLLKMQERNISAELLAREAEFRQKKLIYAAERKEALQQQQKLSTMAKAGKGPGDPDFAALQEQVRLQVANYQKLGAQLDVHKAKTAALRIEEKNYTATLQAKADFIQTLNAKGDEELSRVAKLTAQLAVQRQSFKNLTTDIKSHENAMERLAITEGNLRAKELAETNALEALERAQKAQIDTRKRLEAQYGDLRKKADDLDLAYRREDDTLKKLRLTTGASAEDIAKQENEVKKLEKAWEKERDTLASVERQTEQNTLQQKRLDLEVESSKKHLTDLAGAQAKVNAQIELAKTRETAAIDRAEKHATKLEKLKEKVQQAKDAHAKLGGILGWIAGLFTRTSGNVDKFTAAQQRTATISQLVNQRLFTLGATMRDLAVGSIASFTGNVLSDWVAGLKSAAATGLDTYKANEMLGMSFTALSQRQLVAEGKYKNIIAAQAEASKMSEALLGWMKQLAIQSPFSVDDISGAMRLGNALGFTSQQAALLTQRTVDWASATGGTGDSITSVIRAMGQMHNTGHVTLEDLNQMTDAGLGARDILRNEFAPEILKSKKSLEELISDGVLPADRAIRAMSNSMEKDFGGAAKNSGASMTGLINSLSDLKNQGLAQFFTTTFKAIQIPLQRFVDYMQSDSTVAAVTQFGEMLGNGVGRALTFLSDVAFPAVRQAVAEFGPRIVQGFAFFAALVSEAWDWGYGIGQQFSAGLAATINEIVEVINYIGELISYWMEPHSPPKFLPEIDTWGKKTAEVYFKGWADADFSLLTNMTDKVKETLQGIADTGGLDKGAMISAVVGTESELGNAINEMRQFGAVSESTFQKIQRAAGPAGSQLMAYIRASLENEAATRKVDAAQEELNNVTKRYDAIIDPLRKKLAALQGQGGSASLEKEKANLQKMLDRRNASGITKGNDSLSNRIAAIGLEQEIAAQEQAKAAAVDTAEAKLTAAQEQQQATQAALKMQENLLAAQREQIELTKELIDLQKGAAPEALKADAAEKKAAAERAKNDKAQLEANLAAANSEEEKLSILQEYQSKFEAGSTDYLSIQRRIEVQQDRITAGQAKSNKELAKASEAEFNHALAMADSADKVDLLNERLAILDPTSKEYAKRQIELKKATDAAAKSSKQLTDAEFEAQLAAQTKAGKIDMLNEKLGTLDKGSLEYEKTLRRLNTLERSGAGAGAGGGGKNLKIDKPGAGAGGPLEGLDIMSGKMKDVKASFSGVTDAINNAKQAFADFKAKLEPTFKWLKENSEIIYFVLQRLAISFAVALVLEKLVKPLMAVVFGLGQFVTWGNAVFALMAILGYSWKYNIGGLRDIVADVWGKIQAPLTNIKNIFNEIIAAFKAGGVATAWAELRKRFEELGKNIGDIGTTVWSGVKTWLGPLTEQIGKLFNLVAEWAQNGGLTDALVKLMDTIGAFFSSDAATTTIQLGLLGLVGTLGLVVQSLIAAIGTELLKAWPGLVQYVSEGWTMIGKWFHKYSYLIFPILQTAILALVGALGELLVPALVWLGKRIIDVASWLLPLIPDLLAGIINTLVLLVGWILARGVPLLLGGLIDLFNYAMQKTAEIMPDLGLNLGRAVGSIITTVLITIAGILVAWGAQLFMGIKDGSIWKALLGLVDGIGALFIGGIKLIGSFVMGLLVGLVEPIVNAGRALIMGLGDGFTGGFADFVRRVVENFDAWVAGIKAFFGMSSPSKLFMDLGQMLIDGFLIGVKTLLGQIVTVVAWFAKLWTDIKTTVMTILTAWLKAITDAVTTFIADRMLQFEAFKTDTFKAWDDLTKGVSTTIDGWITNLKATFNAVVLFVSGIWDSIKTTALEVWGGEEGIITGITNLIDGLADSIRDIFGNIVGIIKDKLNDIISLANDAIAAANSVPGVNIPKLPKLAKGAQFFMGGMAMVGENGPELAYLPRGTQVTPASRTLDIFSRAATGVVDKVMDVVSNATAAIEKSAATAASALTNASQYSDARNTAVQQVTVNDTSTHVIEQHDHWNLTTNTRATTPSVAQDYATMKAMSGVTI